jgi:LacI family transcriptional regulator
MKARAFDKATTIERAKLTDVARVANVSLATASRVLNQPVIVSPEVRERVLAAVQALSYTPDRMARALSSGRSFIVGAVVPTLGNAIFADGVEALQDRLSALGYTLLLSNSQYDQQKELDQVKALLEHGVDGLVLVGDTFKPELVSLIRQRGTPCVSTYGAESRNGFPSIGIDNRAATYALTRHLLDLGHRQFGVISNTALSNDRSQARLAGIVEALTDFGLTLAAERIVEIEKPIIANGRAGLYRLLEIQPDISAVVCTTDALAVGAVAAARNLGRESPRDLSISGFDDVEIAAETDPPLTTVRVPASQIGRAAADNLVRAIQGEELPINTLFEARIMIRGSTGDAPARLASSADA